MNRYQGPSRSNNPNQKSKWIKSSEIPKGSEEPLPFKDDLSTIPSDQADNGEATKIQYNTGKKYDYDLADWSGNWAPPPDWGDRPTTQHTEERIRERVTDWFPRADLESHLITGFNKDLIGEICPRDWIPDLIDGVDRKFWWIDHMRDPECEIGPSAKPFWLRYDEKSSTCLDTLEVWEVPNDKIDPRHSNGTKLAQQCSSREMEKYRPSRESKIETARMNRKLNRKPIKEAVSLPIPFENDFSPRANIYVRPAETKDMEQIMKIINYYISETIYIPERQPINQTTVLERYSDVNESRLPYLVAVHRSSKSENDKKNQKLEPNFEDRIVGLVYADDFNDIRSMYRYTVEMEIFVEHSMLRQGIGKALMDKMIHVLDPGYVRHYGYEFVSDDQKYASGGARVVQSIICNVPYNSEDNSEFTWVRDWLVNFDFELCGELFQVGHKLNKIVNLAMFVRRTHSTVTKDAL